MITDTACIALQTSQEGAEDAIGGVWDRQGQRHVVFDIDATRQAARQRALKRGEQLPAARRRLDQVCAPGYLGRKRGEGVRSRTTVLQMHSRQWVGTFSGAGNGDYREELRSACRAIHTYLDASHLPHAMGLVRLDGQYGDGAVIAQVDKTGLPMVVRGRASHLLNHRASPRGVGASTCLRHDSGRQWNSLRSF